MTYGAEIWGPPLIAAAGSAAAGYLKGQGSESGETKMQKTKRKLVDQLLASLQGSGPYSDLFNADEETFNRSFVEPAKERFRNQISPQIQQQYIASGQQRGTGLDDTLTRAGVDLDSMLNQQYYQIQQDAMNRKQGGINAILGGGEGAKNQTSGFQDVMSGLGGYFASKDFSDTASNLFKTRKGFAPDKGEV